MSNYPLSVVLAWVLIVPIVPAFIFQYVLPSTVNISGSLPGFLKGLNLKVVGGIAGYCLLVYVAWAVASAYIQGQWEREQIAQGPKYEEWNVKGEVTLDGPLGNTEHPIIGLIPTFEWSQAGKNTFKFFGSVPIKRLNIKTPQVGYFKALVVSYENFTPTTLDLKEIELPKDNSEITLPAITLSQWKGGNEEEHILKRE
jgi:hypothetical protein